MFVCACVIFNVGADESPSKTDETDAEHVKKKTQRNEEEEITRGWKKAAARGMSEESTRKWKIKRKNYVG